MLYPVKRALRHCFAPPIPPECQPLRPQPPCTLYVEARPPQAGNVTIGCRTWLKGGSGRRPHKRKLALEGNMAAGCLGVDTQSASALRHRNGFACELVWPAVICRNAVKTKGNPRETVALAVCENLLKERYAVLSAITHRPDPREIRHLAALAATEAQIIPRKLDTFNRPA